MGERERAKRWWLELGGRRGVKDRERWVLGVERKRERGWVLGVSGVRETKRSRWGVLGG